MLTLGFLFALLFSVSYSQAISVYVALFSDNTCTNLQSISELSATGGQATCPKKPLRAHPQAQQQQKSSLLLFPRPPCMQFHIESNLQADRTHHVLLEQQIFPLRKRSSAQVCIAIHACANASPRFAARITSSKSLIRTPAKQRALGSFSQLQGGPEVKEST
jgi:hypothetical protein